LQAESAAEPLAATEVSNEVLLARAYLSRVAEPGSVPVSEFVNRLGPVQAAERIRTDDVPELVRNATTASSLFSEVTASVCAWRTPAGPVVCL
jgi:DNA processing protein